MAYLKLTDTSYHSYLRHAKMLPPEKDVEGNEIDLPPLALGNIQQHTMNHYTKLKYKSKEKLVSSSGTRVSPQLHAEQVANKHSDRNDNPSTFTNSYDLNSRHLRRYLIEDVMFLKCTDRIVILIGEKIAILKIGTIYLLNRIMVLIELSLMVISSCRLEPVF